MSAIPMPLEELTGINLDPAQKTPLFRQLYLLLRQRMLDGTLRPGTKLPSSRVLASQLKCGRNTVVTGYDQLLAEGYLESRAGAGTFVASELPESWRQVEAINQPVPVPESKLPLSCYAEHMHLHSIRSFGNNRSFTVGMADLKAFPEKIWNRLTQQIPQAGFGSLMGYCQPQGYQPLREAIADYVSSSRAVRCDASQVIITSGAQQSLDLTARLLLNQGDHAVIEEPGYAGARRALIAAGASLQCCPVDGNGLIVDHLEALTSTPKLVYVTPANQYPMGTVLSLKRRATLLQWAQKNHSWIVEDDYDSEYHYRHRPLASLQGLAQHQNVIYVGSFSKVLFPALRLGYLILPPSLVEVFTKARMEHSGDIAMHSQAVTAAFIQEGHFSRHLKKMRQLYSKKLDIMLTCCQRLEKWCRVHNNGAGMHLVLELLQDHLEEPLSAAMLANGIQHARLSHYFYSSRKQHGLVLGFASSSEDDIRERMGEIENLLIQCEKVSEICKTKAGSIIEKPRKIAELYEGGTTA